MNKSADSPADFPVDEQLMSFIWQSRFISKSVMQSVQGDSLKVMHTGLLNRDQGPDFCLARVDIGGTMFAGHVELHVKTSDWLRHGHSRDPTYGGVILHVVWIHDLPEPVPVNVPLLVLSKQISRDQLEVMGRIMDEKQEFACASYLADTNPMVVRQQWEMALVERLENKHKRILNLLVRHTFHWEQVTLFLIAGYLGAPVNQLPLQMIAERFPWQGVGRLRDNPLLAESVLFGMSGLLDKTYQDDYPRILQKEWLYQKKRLSLTPLQGQPMYFLRMRPAHFPGLRIAQLAALFINGSQLFQSIIEADSPSDLYPLLIYPVHAYWKSHYHFDLNAPEMDRRLGKRQADIILINALVPLVFSYGKCRDDDRFLQKAIVWLESIRPEQNFITRLWQKSNFRAVDSLQTQGMIGQYLSFCKPRRCWECRVAHSACDSHSANL